ncbi:MAG: hypothetical protein QNJ05_00090 [Woeseiaceae bacterium]|nr:hypothetical protein [Woeseiaceae bacterium]
MGAKTWMLVMSNGSARDAFTASIELDRQATTETAHALFPGEELEPLDDGNLCWTNPTDKELCIGCFPDVTVIAAREFGIDNPSRIPERFLEAAGNRLVTVHAMHSVVDWFAYAHWQNGSLVRSLSVAPDSGVVEDIGERMAFEVPYWSGAHAIEEEDEDFEYPLPFHPLELGEEALKYFFGYQLEGFIDPDLLEPEDVPLMRFRRKRRLLKQPFWKFW